jgi:hypothetical protein
VGEVLACQSRHDGETDVRNEEPPNQLLQVARRLLVAAPAKASAETRAMTLLSSFSAVVLVSSPA